MKIIIVGATGTLGTAVTAELAEDLRVVTTAIPFSRLYAESIGL